MKYQMNHFPFFCSQKESNEVIINSQWDLGLHSLPITTGSITTRHQWTVHNISKMDLEGKKTQNSHEKQTKTSTTTECCLTQCLLSAGKQKLRHKNSVSKNSPITFFLYFKPLVLLVSARFKTDLKPTDEKEVSSNKWKSSTIQQVAGAS